MTGDTFFAPAGRASPQQLDEQVRLLVANPLTDGILRAADSLLAVLNEQRQVVSVNEQLLRWLGVENAETLLSLRVGEVLGCVHSREAPAGCGTTRYCMSCGQAIATVTALRSDTVVERKCVIQANREGAPADLSFSVRACPITVGGEKFIALLLRDISEEQRLAASERMVLHDLGNVLNGLQFVPGSSEVPANRQQIQAWADTVNRMLGGLARTLKLHRALVNSWPADYQPAWEEVVFSRLFDDVRLVVTRHPAALGKTLQVDKMTSTVVRTDQAAAARVLMNMLVNAFEATAAGGTVRVTARGEDGFVCVSVWNAKAIPAPLALRIFQRNFSTHAEPGRGLGTVSMKLLGEQLLGGEVHFTSTPEEGTTFVFRLPVRAPA
jgi:hypothetical protein